MLKHMIIHSQLLEGMYVLMNGVNHPRTHGN